ncbi:CHAD domain-containing protein [Bacteroidota bacterium]
MSDLSINIDKPLKQEFIRLINEQIQSAIDVLKDNEIDIEKSIHEARKSIKRIRALLKCIQFAIKMSDYRRENQFLRDIKNLISDIRESTVLIDTLEYCKKHNKKVVAEETFERLHQKLIREKNKAINNYKKTNKLEQTIDTYEIARIRLNNIDFIKTDSKSMIEGINKIYKKGRCLVNNCNKEKDSVMLHELRKAMKYLWYQLSIFKNYWPELINTYTKNFERLSDLLGIEHDLYEIFLYLSQNGTIKEKKDIIPYVIKESDNIKSKFHKEARLLFAEKSKFFNKKFEGLLSLSQNYQ